ncbi:MAG: hypothetical protein NT069_34115 [Planctomycetota bacterium]|nr:hypothetical protein [Planctomycetota bacterium]
MSGSEATLLRFSPRITALPVIHGSGDFAIEVRRRMLAESFDCLAIPLPESFQSDVERAVADLSAVGVVIQREYSRFSVEEWTPESDARESEQQNPAASYVPIDPCQPVIAALRLALDERIPRRFIDLETAHFEPRSQILPDPYALKQTGLEKFAAAVLPVTPRPTSKQAVDRIQTMARRLRDLERKYRSILFLCSFTDWPWLKEAYDAQTPALDDEEVEPTERLNPAPNTLLFLLGELPYITGLYERARAELDDDENLSVDGVKELLLAARDHDRASHGRRARKLSPQRMALYLRYVRNLALIERRMTPDLYTLIVGAQQIGGDQFAASLAEVSRNYPFPAVGDHPTIALGVGRGRLDDGTVLELKSRLEGPAVTWRTLQLKRQPNRVRQDEWRTRWNPYSHCSWPPEDVAIEKFRTHVKDKARQLLGLDLARTEKFTTSLRDGLDLRETLRNWHTGDLYVKVMPPTRGSLDCVIMLFDSPADPRDYPWRVTWHAEHHDESTLALFATDFSKEMVGPGIALATYGGAMFLFPPRPIDDIWTDRRLNFTDTLEERLVAAGCLHSEHKHIAILSESPPGPGFRQLARKYGKKLLHVPLSHFSQEIISQLRLVHVLNGRSVRSYAADFIRKA